MISEKEWEDHTKGKRGFGRVDSTSTSTRGASEKVYNPILIQTSYGEISGHIDNLKGKSVFLLKSVKVISTSIRCIILNDDNGQCDRDLMNDKFKSLIGEGWKRFKAEQCIEALTPHSNFAIKEENINES
jgi:hypothetical protein